MNFDIVDGLRAALQQQHIDDVQFMPMNIGVAGKDEDVYARCEQALLDGADLVIAYINPQTAEFVQPLFENSDRILLVLDSGFQFPSKATERSLTNVYFLSLEGNLCCRIAAHLAAVEGARNAAYTCSFFDAGFRSGYAFHNAINEQGGHITFNHITALKRQDFTIDPLVRHMEGGSTDTILAAFCGDMAEDFFRESATTGIFRDYRVVASPFMAEEVWLDKLAYPGGDFMAAVPWGRSLDLPQNELFLQSLNKPGKANVFSLLAWEAGLLLADIAAASDTQAAAAALDKGAWESPRGTLRMNALTHRVEAPVYKATVVRNETNGHCSLRVGEEVSFTEEERKKLQEDIDNFEGTHNSWFNAYPCLDS